MIDNDPSLGHGQEMRLTGQLFLLMPEGFQASMKADPSKLSDLKQRQSAERRRGKAKG